MKNKVNEILKTQQMSKLKMKCNEIMNELEVKEVEEISDNTEKK